MAKWQRCRDAYDGEDAIKGRGVTYLPKMSSLQDSREYDAYRVRAPYYEAVGRTVNGFVGAIARKPHLFKFPAKLEPLLSDVTSDGMGMPEFVKTLCAENILQSRLGVLVDFDEVKGLPYLAYYTAEAIINWGDDWVILSEISYEPDPEDRFALKAIQQYRHLHIADGVYTVDIWRLRKDSAASVEKWAKVSTVIPALRGRPLQSLPWFWCGMAGQTSRITNPPLLGLVNVSISHYRNGADLEHGRHFAGRPTLYITGADKDMSVHVGGAAAILLENPASKVGYAEFTGQGLGSLENALKHKEAQLGAMGAAAFAKGEAKSEPVVTATIRANGETSLLAAATSAVEETLNSALNFAAEWAGASGDVQIRLNRDFVDQALDAPTLVAMVTALQTGQLTVETFVWNLDQAGMLRPGVTLEEEAVAVRAAQDKAKAAQVALSSGGTGAVP